VLIYGDHTRERETFALLAAIDDRLAGAHDDLVTAFLLAGELAQGIADAELTERGCDARSRATDLAMQLLAAIARAIDVSWRGTRAAPAEARLQVIALANAALPATLRTKRAEGHAYYAVYPEAYLAAARRAPVVADHVIGIRSIGCGLAALVAAATGAPLPATVRPRGDPYRRELHVAPELVAEWTRDPDAFVAIADEGPGMSGSSFGAVADLLESHGIRHLLCFPSHAGPLGVAASERHRERWQRMRRYVVTADELLRDRLPVWLEPLVGPLAEPLVELSAGAWRRLRYASEHDWPPSFLQQERLKFLAHTATGTWLARFVGLGEAGEQALDLARATSAAGFTPELAGLTHGFLVERWLDASPLDLCAVDRDYLIDRVGSYLALRATRAHPPGASCLDLIAMVRRNVTLGVGAARAAELGDRLSLAPAAMHPVQIDGKLHAWEWLVQRDGTLMKTDAYDHHASHDLIGCQDIAWDVVGAATELALDADEEHQLAARVGADAQRIAFLRPCYLAFQLGRASHAAAVNDAAEAARLRSAAACYAQLLTSRC
jgi:hypothetical protein